MEFPGNCPACGAGDYRILTEKTVTVAPAAWPGPKPDSSQHSITVTQPLTPVEECTVWCAGCGTEYRLVRGTLVPLRQLDSIQVLGTCYSLDGDYSATFCWNLWLATATERELMELGDGNWSHSDNADDIALFCGRFDPSVASVLRHCSHDGLLHTDMLETELDKDLALGWLRSFRNDVYQKLVREFSFHLVLRREPYFDLDECPLDLAAPYQVLLDVADFATMELNDFFAGRLGGDAAPGIAYLFPDFTESSDKIELDVVALNDECADHDSIQQFAEMQRLLSGKVLVLPDGIISLTPGQASRGKVLPFTKR